MKLIKRTALGAMGLIVAQVAQADTVCRVQTLGSNICGDGKVEVKMFDDGTFKLHHGDVHCWGQNTEGSGDLIEISPDYNDRKGVRKYELLSKFGDQEISFGTFKVNKERSLARVKLNRQYLSNANATEYNFSCLDQEKESFMVDATASGCVARDVAFRAARRKASELCSEIHESYVPLGSLYVTKEEGPGCWSLENNIKTVTAEMKFTCVKKNKEAGS